MKSQAPRPVQAKSKGGRPRGFDRDAALDAALALFWQHGYDGVAISDLTTVIGIAPPSLYAAFGGKEALYRAALRRYLELGQAGGPLPSGGTAYEAVAATLRSAVRAVTQSGRPTGCLMSSGLLACSVDAAALAEEHRRLRAAMVTEFQRRITKGIKAGELPKGTVAATLARFYVTVLQGLSVQARDGASVEDLEQVAQHALAAWPQ